jgi:hypothetical protein
MYCVSVPCPVTVRELVATGVLFMGLLERVSHTHTIQQLKDAIREEIANWNQGLLGLVFDNFVNRLRQWAADEGGSLQVAMYSFIHLVVCLTTGPKPLPKRALHIGRSRASSFKWEYPLLSLRSSSSFLHLLPRLPVTSIPPFIFPPITLSIKQFQRKMWPIQFAFRLRISFRIFLCSLTISKTFSFLTQWIPYRFKFTYIRYTTTQKSSSHLLRAGSQQFFWSPERT